MSDVLRRDEARERAKHFEQPWQEEWRAKVRKLRGDDLLGSYWEPYVYPAFPGGPEMFGLTTLVERPDGVTTTVRISGTFADSVVAEANRLDYETLHHEP